MAGIEKAENPPLKRKSKAPILVGVLLMLILGAGGFYVTYSGMILGGGDGSGGASLGDNDEHAPVDFSFIPVDPLIISLGNNGQNRHLRFSSQLEVTAANRAEVTLLMPRILDVLNGYLRAIQVSELEDPASLFRLRAQMLRRVQIVTGDGRVRDLLVTEFVLN